MLKMRVRVCSLIVGVLLAVGPSVRAEEGATGLSLDEEFALFAEEVPGFGGLYLDAEGTTHVYLRDLSYAREVQGLGERVEVHQGEYDFRDLFIWKAEVRDLLDARGAVFLDIDEQRNRLVFGVERDALDAFARELQVFLRETRVPSGAVLVEAAEPIIAQEQLTDRIRPVPGGVQIQGAGKTCTLGVNATFLGVRGFVTNSHCTATRSVVDGTVAFQSTVSGDNRIGLEVLDPKFFTGGSCPSKRRCRLSDAAFFNYDDGVNLSQGGKIANPVVCGLGGAPGSLLVSPGHPRWSISSALFGSPVSGTFQSKVGRTTGCTLGEQVNTCLDTNVFMKGPFGFPVFTDITMLCQNRVAALSDSGDSGSPVFQIKKDKALLSGILWGGSGTGSGATFVYSPWLFIFTELGPVSPDLP